MSKERKHRLFVDDVAEEMLGLVETHLSITTGELKKAIGISDPLNSTDFKLTPSSFRGLLLRVYHSICRLMDECDRLNASDAERYRVLRKTTDAVWNLMLYERPVE
jgi:hypothetical protein